MKHQCKFQAWFDKNDAKVVIETGSFDVTRHYGGVLTVVARVEIGSPISWDQKFEFALPVDATVAQCVAARMIEASELGSLTFSDYCNRTGSDELDNKAHVEWVRLYKLNESLNEGFGNNTLYNFERLYYHSKEG